MKTHEVEKNAQLIYRLMGLGMSGAVLHIGAHPDDEDIGLLAYLSCKYGVRALYWSATRGEGGQNRIGPYRDEALGIYRTWESLAARSLDRSECLFGPFYDFGYSKNAEEAFAKWGREALVREIVRVIRFTQPQIIVSRWTGTPNDFHGQHQAVGQAAIEAFKAAGDPTQFSELEAQGLMAWQPLKFYHSVDNSGGGLTPEGALNFSGRINPAFEKDGFLRMNTGEFDPISGRTYQERAYFAYNQHQTQAMGLAPAPGDFFYYFFLYKSLVPVPQKETSLFDGLDPSLTGLGDYPGDGHQPLRAHLEKIKTTTNGALERFRADDPMAASSSLLEALSLVRETVENLDKMDLSRLAPKAIRLYLSRKMIELEEVIATCLGFEMECLIERARIIPGDCFRVSARLWNHREIGLGEAAFKIHVPKGWHYRSLETERSTQPPLLQESGKSPKFFDAHFEITTPETAELTCPYWLAKPRKNYAYDWSEGESSGLSFGSSPVNILCRVHFGPYQVTLKRAAVYREGFPGGFRELPLAVIPPISIHPKTDKQFLQFRDEDQNLELQVLVRNNSDHDIDGRLELLIPRGWKVVPERIDLDLPEPGESKTLRHRITVPAGTSAGRYSVGYQIRYKDRNYAVIVTPVRMGIPGHSTTTDGSNCIHEEFILAPSQVVVHVIDVKFVQKLRYAYVQGAQEDLIDVLKPFGLEFHLMMDEEMGYIDLSQFDAVVIGPNAYLIRDELRKHASRFLEYAQQGGVLIVQYQGYLYQAKGLAPYPFKYNQPHDRVTHEDAPVDILDPEHVLFRLPNPIGLGDFDGWIRDRGLYFFGQWDPRYHPLLSCSDPGESPLQGGFLECQYGRGAYIYTGYSFFRQLAAGVPGAFRLFANLLSMPEARVLERIEFLKKVSLFSLLTDPQLDSIARIMSERWFEEGTYVCRQGEYGDELYIVYQGKVEVVRESEEKEEIIYLAKEGDCLGEMAVLGDIRRTASLRASGPVQILVIEGSHFQNLLRQNPEMSLQVIKLLVKRLAPSTG